MDTGQVNERALCGRHHDGHCGLSSSNAFCIWGLAEFAWSSFSQPAMWQCGKRIRSWCVCDSQDMGRFFRIHGKGVGCLLRRVLKGFTPTALLGTQKGRVERLNVPHLRRHLWVPFRALRGAPARLLAGGFRAHDVGQPEGVRWQVPRAPAPSASVSSPAYGGRSTMNEGLWHLLLL